VTSSLAVFEAAIRVKINASDKIMFKTQKKGENVDIKDVLHKAPSKIFFEWN